MLFFEILSVEQDPIGFKFLVSKDDKTLGAGDSLNQQTETNKLSEFKQKMIEFIQSSAGLEVLDSQSTDFAIRQKVDLKSIVIKIDQIQNLIQRADTEGVPFLQVNLKDNKKILITENLIGFKPAVLGGLDTSRIPKVVTTQDLRSVFDAIEEALYLNENPNEEIQLLKKIFDSVIAGGEHIGFDLNRERSWLLRLPINFFNLSA